MNDLISRQDAIDAFDGTKVNEEDCTEYDIGYNDGIDFAVSKLSVLPSAQPELGENSPSEQPKMNELGVKIGETCTDAISRQEAIDAVHGAIFDFFDICDDDKESPLTYWDKKLLELNKAITTPIKNLSSAQPEPISEAYAKAVFTWLLNYQIKTAEMEGRYIPYEVLSWVANDWRKENEIN